MHHQQVRVLADEAHRRFAPKIHIGFVHQHHTLRVQLQQSFDLRQRNADARGRVGVGHHHTGHVLPLRARKSLYVHA